MSRRSDTLNKQIKGDDLTPVASASRSASGNSGWLSAEDFATLVLKLDVTVFAMTTLDAKVEEASDASGTDARDVASFTQASGVTSQRKSFTVADKFYRVSWVKTGGTSATFSVAGFSK